MNKIKILASIALVALTSASAFAETTTANSQVSAQVLPSCKITPPDNINYPANEPIYGMARMVKSSIICTKGTVYSIAINIGENNNNQMTSPDSSDVLNYFMNISRDDTDLWGEHINNIGNGDNQTVTFLTGIRPTNIYVKPGVYSDTRTITFTY